MANGAWSEGKIAVVDFTVGSVVFKSRALTLPGEDMAWTALISMKVKDRDMTSKMIQLIQEDSLPEEDTHFLPPHMQGGQLQGAVLVSEGEVMEKQKPSVSVEPMGQSEEPEPNGQHARVEAEGAVESEQILVDGVGLTLVDVEVDGDAQEGRGWKTLLLLSP